MNILVVSHGFGFIEISVAMKEIYNVMMLDNFRIVVDKQAAGREINVDGSNAIRGAKDLAHFIRYVLIAFDERAFDPESSGCIVHVKAHSAVLLTKYLIYLTKFTLQHDEGNVTVMLQFGAFEYMNMLNSTMSSNGIIRDII